MNIIRFLPKYPDFGVNARQSIFYIFFLWKKEKKRKKENCLKFVFFWRTGLTTATRGHLNTTRIKATMRKAVQALSSAKASLCLREAGEKEKESARGTMGREKIYERLIREAPILSLFPSSSARLLFFHYCYFYWDTQWEPLRRRERCGRKEIDKSRVSPSDPCME